MGERRYVDGTCRREPDFEHQFPGISALCRPGPDGFTNNLFPGSRVFYITSKAKYGGAIKSHYKLVAYMEVIERFDNHQKAADWYFKQALRLPYNCMLPNNPRLDHARTFISPARAIIDDRLYRERANECGTFLAMKHVLPAKLDNPNTMTEDDSFKIFGHSKIGSKTQKAGFPISPTQLDQLLELFKKHQ